MLPVQIGKQTHEAAHSGQGSATATAGALTDNHWPALYGVYIRNHDGSNPMYVGDSTVTTSTGFRIDAGDSLWVPVEFAKNLYAISGGTIAYSFLSI